MNILVDENIAFATEAFGTLGTVFKMPGREITRQHLSDIDFLIVRSVTQINRNLLDSARTSFVGTTTIGTDHFDINFLNERGIKFASSPGCNSQAVAEYVFSAVINIAAKNKISLENNSIGIIGYGNIGKKVAKLCKIIGLKVLVNDPPLEKAENDFSFSCLDEVLKADIITLHVPYTSEGKYKTHYLIDKKEIEELKGNVILINTSRGSVVNNDALYYALNRKNLFTIFDVWENEPELSKELLEQINIATQHIAGYSLEGKVNGTKIIYDKLCNFLDNEISWEPKLPKVSNNVFHYSYNYDLLTNLNNFTKVISHLDEDTIELKKASNFNSKELSNYFDKLRKNYKLRREFNNYTIQM
ncbi:MAG: DUF3410 domain-containing protein, partial [Ignavibacteriae bacterium]|nr:DUF3410 domain-containing protein [Ignavibacteriota bacterium]